jgi:hypothetical protein
MTRRNFQFPSYIQPYVDQKTLTPEQAEKHWFKLQHKDIRELIDTDVISMETALNLRDSQRNALTNDKSIRQRVISRELNIAFVDCPVLQNYVNQKKITLERALDFTESLIFKELVPKKINSLHWFLNALIESGTITFERALKLGHNEIKNIESKSVQELIEHGVINMESALNLSYGQREALTDNESIKERVIKRELHINVAHRPYLQELLNQGLVFIGQQRDQIMYFDEKTNQDTILIEWLQPKLEPSHIRTLILEKKISLTELFSLTQEQYNSLSDESIQKRLIEGRLDIRSFLSPFLEQCVEQGFITSDQAMDLHREFDFNIDYRNENIRKLILHGVLKFEAAPHITGNQIRALEDPKIMQQVLTGELNILLCNYPFLQDWVNNGYTTVEQASGMHSHQREDLEKTHIGTLITKKIITFNDFMDLDSSQRHELATDDDTFQRVLDGKLDVRLCEYPFLQEYVDNKHTTIDGAFKLTADDYFSQNRRFLLLQPDIRELILDNSIDFEAAIDLDENQLEALRDDTIKQRVINKELHVKFVDCSMLQDYYVKQNKLSLERALALNFHELNNLRSNDVRDLIESGVIGIDTAINLTVAHREALSDAGIKQRVIEEMLDIAFVDVPFLQECVDDDRIELNAAIEMSSRHKESLTDERFQQLIREDILTLEQLDHLSLYHWNVIQWDDHYEWLMARRITIDDILQLEAHQTIDIEQHEERIRANAFHGAANLEYINAAAIRANAFHGAAFLGVINVPLRADEEPFNDRQSTHTSSVHSSVSESAIRLMESYGDQIEGHKLENVISELESYVSSLDDGTLQNKSAKKCIKRITKPNYTYSDKTSNISIRQLLALTFLAINDSRKREGTLEDAKIQYIEGLYEIQRGYNLSATGKDEGQDSDANICTAGTFNKLIEKLQGIHPDCEVIFVTQGLASRKLPIVVKEEAVRHLTSLASPTTSEGFIAFTQLISEVINNGVEVIWNSIKEKIGDRIFDEFKTVFKSREDEAFIEFIELGQYTELGDLKRLQEHLEKSDGYREYCSNSLRKSGIFTSMMPKSDNDDKDKPGPKKKP